MFKILQVKVICCICQSNEFEREVKQNLGGTQGGSQKYGYPWPTQSPLHNHHWLRVCRCSCRYTLYHTQNSNHLDQNIGIIWHKRSLLVNDNTVGYNVSQEKKTLSRNYLRWRYRRKRNFLGSAIDKKSRLVGFLKQAKNRVSNWSFPRNTIAY